MNRKKLSKHGNNIKKNVYINWKIYKHFKTSTFKKTYTC